MELAGFLHGLPADASELEKVLARQAELKNLVRKYAPDIDGVIAWRDDARRRLAAIDDSSVSIESLEADARAAADDLRSAATTLTAARTKSASTLGTKVTTELRAWQCRVRRWPSPCRPTRRGRTTPERSTSAGSGATQARRASIASSSPGRALRGPGAADRAVGVRWRAVACDAGPRGRPGRPGGGSTMVFDEVDAGVGGRAAVEIGRRLAALARNHQVIVVTHLPQVAAFADHHIVIGKTTGKSSVTSSVTTLDDRDGRVAELARMLAGLGDSDTGRAHAEELLDTAEGEKTSAECRRPVLLV